MSDNIEFVKQAGNLLESLNRSQMQLTDDEYDLASALGKFIRRSGDDVELERAWYLKD